MDVEAASRSRTRAPGNLVGARRRQLPTRVVAGRLVFLLPVTVFLLLMFAYPMAFNFWLTFQSYDLASLVTGASEFVGLDNIVTAINDPGFAGAAVNTAVFTVVSLVVQFVIGLGLALFFYNRFPLSTTIRALLVLPWLVPSIVATTAWRFIFQDPNGFLNQLLGHFGVPPVHWLTSSDTALLSIIIVNIWIGIAFNLVLLHSGLQSIPTERYEAAQIDGAGYWQRFWYITVPALGPVTAVLLVLGFVYTLKQFDLVWTLTQGGPGNSSQLLSTWSYTLSFNNNNFGQGAAVADFLFVASGIVIVFYTLVQRRQNNA